MQRSQPALRPLHLRNHIASVGATGLSLLCFLSLICFLATVGCEPPKDQPKAGMKSSSSHDHGHDHGHSHGDEHGPNGGHLVDVSPSNLHAEWAHDDEKELVSVYVDDFKKAGKVVEGVKIEVASEGNPAKSYELAVNDKGFYSIKDLELLTALEMAGDEKESKVKATLQMTVDGKPEQAAIVHHDHGHHH
jgi:hypothetical protein